VYKRQPYDYYLSKKIELATAMLRDSNLSIDAIAERLNFADRNHFTKLYSKKTGVSPARYRKSVQMTTD
jgi:transcriptional regulator GlxA family with amidase domain